MQPHTSPSNVDPVHLELDQLNPHTQLPTTPVSRCLDALLQRTGEAVSWVWVLLMAVIILNVFMRYALGEGRIEFEELQWHLYAIGWLLALSYCFAADDHVRVDLLHHRFSLRTQAWVELFGILFLLLPFIGTVLWYAIPFISYSWQTSEVSGDPGGLPYRWLIKSVLFAGFFLLALATVSRLSRVIALLFPARRLATSTAARV